MRSIDTTSPGARPPLRILYSLLPVGPDAEGRLVALPGQLLGPFYVEDRLIGPRRIPSSLLVTQMLVILQGPENDLFRMKLCRTVAREFFPHPVDARRRHAAYQAAAARARERGTTRERVIEDATTAAIALLTPSDVVSSPNRSFEQAVRQRVNELVTEDFLGPAWRHRLGTGRPGEPREVDLAEGAPLASANAEDLGIEGQAVTALLNRAKLSPGERTVMTAVLDGWKVAEWARAHGMSASAARTVLMRARRKLKKTAGK